MATALDLGFCGVQLCENLSYATSPDEELAAVAEIADANRLFLELGLRDLSAESLAHHLDLAERMGARLVRVVIGPQGPYPAPNPDELVESAIDTIATAIPRLESTGIRIGVENNFDITTPRLVEVVESVDHELVGYVFDTTNGVGFVERPEETLEALSSRLFSVHVKDYEIEKVEAGYFVSGCVLGHGELDLDPILAAIATSEYDPSIILEVKIRKDRCNERSVVAWERHQVEASLQYLRAAIDRLTAVREERSE